MSRLFNVGEVCENIRCWFGYLLHSWRGHPQFIWPNGLIIIFIITHQASHIVLLTLLPSWQLTFARLQVLWGPRCSRFTQFGHVFVIFPWCMSSELTGRYDGGAGIRKARNASKTHPWFRLWQTIWGDGSPYEDTNTQPHLMPVPSTTRGDHNYDGGQTLCRTSGNMWWTRRSASGIRRLVWRTLVLETHVGKVYAAATLVPSASCRWDRGPRASASTRPTFWVWTARNAWNQ
jgi:hypothetical protein